VSFGCKIIWDTRLLAKSTSQSLDWVQVISDQFIIKSFTSMVDAIGIDRQHLKYSLVEFSRMHLPYSHLFFCRDTYLPYRMENGDIVF
jgi:hypothetical protein